VICGRPLCANRCPLHVSCGVLTDALRWLPWELLAGAAPWLASLLLELEVAQVSSFL
jgi:hypothetical protein